MPTFSSYPAMQVKVADIPGAMQRGRESAQKNQLFQSEIAEQGRMNQLRAVMPDVGAEAGLGPQAQKALALDPSMLGKLLKIPKGERDQAKETAKVLSNFGMAILNASGIQRPPLDAQMRQAAAEYGVDPSKIPPLGDPSYEAFLTGNIAKAGQIVAMLDQAEQATPPSGYRRTEAGGLELSPGYLEGQRDLAAAKRGPDGSPTALQKDVPYIAKLMGVSQQEALNLKLSSRGKSYDDYVADIAARLSSFEGTGRAYEKAKALADLVYGRVKKPPEAGPESKEGRNWLQKFLGFGGDDEIEPKKPTGGTSGPRGRRGARASAVKRGSRGNPHTPESQADFDAIQSGKFYTDPDDQKLYRKP